MAPASKTSQSGLRTFKRDFSASSLSSQPLDIDWPSSPPPQPKVLTGPEKRLKDIQDALNAMKKSTPSQATPPPAPLATSKTVNKRPSDTMPTDSNPVAKKRRELPTSWDKPAPQRHTTNVRPSGVKEVYAAPPTTTRAPGKVAPVFLSDEQKAILRLVQEGNSVFYTGSAGTGKSVLLREIIKMLRTKYAKSTDAIAITASTGIAACNIGGVTIHSFAGVGIATEPPDLLAQKVQKNKKAASRWLRTKVLIIDEVSMVDGDFFDKLSIVGSKIRRRAEPFGGVQVIVTGDFFQLPPVTKSGPTKFAFEAKLWSQTIKRTFNLTKVFRQHDQEFVNMLNEMRFGCLSPESIAKFRSLSREIIYDDGLGPTELFPRREDVDRSNAGRLHNLDTEARTYHSIDGGTQAQFDSGKKLLANFMAPETLTLRKGAQVMLVKNVDETLVNGSMGRVRRFVDPNQYGYDEEPETKKPSAPASKGKKNMTVTTPQLYPEVEFALLNGSKRLVLVQPEISKVELPNGEVQVSRAQLPLILAWAMSIHKSQGQTLDRVKVDLGKVFEKGQAYVALSRATSLEGLQVLHFDPAKVMAHPKVVAWSKTLETVSLDE